MADSLLNYALNFVVNCTDVRNDLHYVECDVKLYTIPYNIILRSGLFGGHESGSS